MRGHRIENRRRAHCSGPIALAATAALLIAPWVAAQTTPRADAPAKLDLRLRPQAPGTAPRAGDGQASAPQSPAGQNTKRDTPTFTFDQPGQHPSTALPQDHGTQATGRDPSQRPNCPTPREVLGSSSKPKARHYPNCPDWRMPAAVK